MKKKKNQKEESDFRFIKLTEENWKQDEHVRMAPSVNIMKMIVDVIANEGLRGYIVDDKHVRLGITIMADKNDILKNENLYIEELVNKDEDGREKNE